MTRVGSILELPFHERPAFELLGFDPTGQRTALNLEDTSFGWCRPDAIWLDAAGAPAGLVEVRRPLLLALHSADDGPALPGDIVLEFVLADGAAVAAPLSRFLERWLPRLPGEGGEGGAARPIVLALCNPHRAQLAAPAAAAGRPVHYALGDVDAWLDLDGPDGAALAGRIRLAAPAWRRAG